ncbi:MAG: NAD(P)H-binding protein [Acidobacteria bacterium]|nr:NAD(P)H-binding protein [Acidobacteriota bacterium]
MSEILILGAGYTGWRVARLLAAAGHAVTATVRDPARVRPVPGVRLRALNLPGSAQLAAAPGCRVLHSIPVSEDLYDPTPALCESLRGAAARVVYLSTTGVYGRCRQVDERTPPAPGSASNRLRVEAEQLVLNGPWLGMVLRPAAIYGPGRGAQVSIPAGRFRLRGDGSNFVSRIHVDDLAALAAAALLSDAGGAWPVADQEPARSREVAAYVCGLLGCPMPESAADEELHETRRADRQVDGSAVFRLLGVELRYRSFRQGIPASLGSA